MRIPFNKPYVIGTESEYFAQALANNHLSGDGLGLPAGWIVVGSNYTP